MESRSNLFCNLCRCNLLRDGVFFFPGPIIGVILLLPASLISFHFGFSSSRPDPKDRLTRPLKKTDVIGCATVMIVLGFISLPFLWPQWTCQPPSKNSVAEYNLRDACTYQEVYYVDHDTYADSIEKITGNDYYFFPDEGVILSVIAGDKSHYEMMAFHLEGDKKFEVHGPGGDIRALPKTEVRGFGNSVESLVIALKEEDASTRASAAFALGGAKKGLAVEALIGVLREDKVGIVRQSAAGALALMKDKRALEALIGGSNDEDEGVRRIVYSAISKASGHYAVGPLIDALNESDDEDVRINAVKALRYVEDNRVFEPLVLALKKDRERVRREVVLSLPHNRKSIPPLIDALKDEDGTGRLYAIRRLGWIDDERSFEPLEELLNDEHDTVREEAALSLGRLNYRLGKK
jgi:hypothetical protein